MKRFVAAASLAALLASPSFGITIGYFDNTRELWGFSSSNGGYLSEAREYLEGKGHTLVSTDMADAAFLSTVDAFFTGLISSVSVAEVQAMQDFVDVDGGFLFIQQDHDSGPWHPPSQQILANWGIASSSGTFGNDSGHTTIGTSEWVTNPNVVTGFSGAAHSAVGNIPVGFETLAQDDAGRIIMGVFDAGAGRSSDVFVATDIDFFSNDYGWTDSRNRALWENIWSTAGGQIDPPDRVPDSGSTILLLLASVATLAKIARRHRA